MRNAVTEKSRAVQPSGRKWSLSGPRTRQLSVQMWGPPVAKMGQLSSGKWGLSGPKMGQLSVQTWSHGCLYAGQKTCCLAGPRIEHPSGPCRIS